MSEIIEYLKEKGPTRVLTAIKDLDLNNRENNGEMNRLLEEEEVVLRTRPDGSQWYALPSQKVSEPRGDVPKEKESGNTCHDCGRPIGARAKRCSSCAARHRLAKRTQGGDDDLQAARERYRVEREAVIHLTKIRERDKILIETQETTINTLKKEVEDEMDKRIQLQQENRELQETVQQQAAKIKWLLAVLLEFYRKVVVGPEVKK